ncbi:Insulinoma-associated protein 2 [Trichostrongylus colubriformis]|uniref:Insulinoma-associated protein 2 n=1 Tax=Trichostrongylus colubriformis TaxID=6319 RepID=A0AAN8EW96_TRICO
MSFSDFWVHRLISTTTPSPVPSCSSASSDDISKLSDVPPLLKPEAVKPMTDFGALQMLQLQLMWQPQIMQNFLAMIQTDQEQRQQQQLLQFKEISTSNVAASRKRPSSVVSEGKKTKQRKLGDDTVNASPVSGMFIKDESAVPPAEELQKDADSLDETAAYVEVSEESRKKIEAIENVIGDCVCCLCKVRYDDVFKLAQHRCPRIAHEEYRCPECEKIFSCPANLASHRRWHRPKDQTETFRCISCSSTFNTRKEFKAHSCKESFRSTMPFESLFTSLISAPLAPLKLEMH